VNQNRGDIERRHVNTHTSFHDDIEPHDVLSVVYFFIDPAFHYKMFPEY